MYITYAGELFRTLDSRRIKPPGLALHTALSFFIITLKFSSSAKEEEEEEEAEEKRHSAHTGDNLTQLCYHYSIPSLISPTILRPFSMNSDSLQLGKQCPHLHFLLTFLSRTNLAGAQSENPLKDREGKLRERREQVLKTNADKGLVFNDGDMIVNEAQEEGGRGWN